MSKPVQGFPHGDLRRLALRDERGGIIDGIERCPSRNQGTHRGPLSRLSLCWFALLIQWPVARLARDSRYTPLRAVACQPRMLRHSGNASRFEFGCAQNGQTEREGGRPWRRGGHSRAHGHECSGRASHSARRVRDAICRSGWSGTSGHLAHGRGRRTLSPLRNAGSGKGSPTEAVRRLPARILNAP